MPGAEKHRQGPAATPTSKVGARQQHYSTNPDPRQQAFELTETESNLDLQHLLDGVSAEGDRQAIVGLRGLQHFKSSFGGLEDFMLQRLENEGN